MASFVETRSIRRAVRCATVAVAGLCAGAAAAQTNPVLPSGGSVRSGDASIGAASGGAMAIVQSSPTAVIDWNGFSIGAGGAVTFANGSGATLNRVTGANASQIDGRLSASGSLYLLNPNGVVVGQSGVVDVGGGFVASTLDVDDAAFRRDSDLSFAGTSRAAVINLGRISALGGDVALIAAQVRNEGGIAAPAGSVALAAGTAVLLRDVALDGGKISVLVGGADTSATNAGGLTAAAIELRAAGGSVYALAGNMGGLIRATTVQNAGARIFLTADRVTVASGAVLDASGADGGGTVAAIAAGALRFAGTALARGGKGAGGDVETSGASVDLAGASVDTTGTTTGLWLIDPIDLTVDAPAASAINRGLQTTNVTLQTTATGTSGPGTTSNGLGDIIVAAPLAWSTANRLTLDALNAIRIDADITIGGAGKLALNTARDASGVLLSFGSGSAVSFTSAGNAGRALTVNGQAYQLIDQFAQLAAIRDARLSGLYAVAKPLNASGTVYTGAVIGAGGTPFTGTLEGLGNTISGLTIRAPGVIGVGLFSNLQGTARDLVLRGGSIVGGGGFGSDPSGAFLVAGTGALAGLVSDGGVVTNVSSNYSVTAQPGPEGARYTGGLIGYLAGGFVTNASASGAVRGESAVGGLIGWIDGGVNGGGIVTNASASGNVTGVSQVGGLIGYMQRAQINFASATGDVTGYSSLGGLVGATALASIADARASGTVTGTDTARSFSGNVGGLVGTFQRGSIVRSIATGRVAGYQRVGGLVGQMDGTITQSQATGMVRGHTDVGGLVGGAQSFDATLTIVDSQASGAVSGTTAVGGLLGNGGFHLVEVTRSRASGTVSAGIGSTSVGGLIGEVQQATLTDNVASGRVTGETYVGGLIGRAIISSLSGDMASGPVKGIGAAMDAGGLIGSSLENTIANVRATGSVLGRTDVGGLLGYRDGGTLDGASATGTVRGRDYVGRLIGYDVQAGGPVN